MEVITTAVLSALGTFIGYLVGARKRQAETDSIVLENVKGILELQRVTIEKLSDEVQELKSKIIDYEKYIGKLKDEISHMREEMNSPTKVSRQKKQSN